LYRIVKHSERPLAYAVDWLFQRVAGEFIAVYHVLSSTFVSSLVCRSPAVWLFTGIQFIPLKFVLVYHVLQFSPALFVLILTICPPFSCHAFSVSLVNTTFGIKHCPIMM